MIMMIDKKERFTLLVASPSNLLNLITVEGDGNDCWMYISEGFL